MNISKNTSLIILDWDDTLFPTKWVQKNHIDLSTVDSREQYLVYFHELDKILHKILSKMNKLGKVIIVTNALKSWLNLSIVVLPSTYRVLKKIEIVSARELYADESDNPMDWKMGAFRDIIDREFKSRSLMNVISVGDAEYEYQALISINDMKKHNKKYLKSIKFLRHPTHDILIDQLNVLNSAIPQVWATNSHLDLKLDFYSNVKIK